ncbi:hypothetical protein QTQ03_15925 [Micromonospora sp. WMMA1363]|uniref:hypothetical protein n=1 Tax=Micromonospora sp. WMMA1363 TaxID=3053985 RepID=UPI00259D0D9E|nr:hypothetical protein [Micromonospora sp. WMMA1363]MDM4721009.1 hypothetical protein [Micromonospora sp. WMMA1363]
MRTTGIFGLGAAICVASAAALTPAAAAHADPFDGEDRAPAAHARPFDGEDRAPAAPGNGPRLDDDKHAHPVRSGRFKRIDLTTEAINSYRDIPPSGPSAGDVTLSTGYLLKGGQRVGRFGNQCVFLMANAEQTLQCQQTWALDSVGTLTSQALTVQSAMPGPRTWTSVINNGSERFFGASGIVVTEKESQSSTSDTITIYLVDTSFPETPEW